MDVGETKEGNAPEGYQPSAYRACDNCRARKIKCDRASPCSNCRIGNSICRTTPRVKEQRQRVLISHQYEKKIETIDERLSTIENLLKNLALSMPAASVTQSAYQNADKQPPSQQEEGSAYAPILQEPEPAKPTAEFEGESSFSAHSIHASEVFEKTMRKSPFTEHVPMMSHALSALQDIVKRQSLPSSINVLRFPGQQPKKNVNISQLELPPSNAVVALLRFANDVSQFTHMCKDLYFCTEEYPPARFATANCILSYLFGEYNNRFPDNPLTTKFDEHSTLCISNFTTVISTFDLFMEPSFDTIMALAFAAFHATECSKISLCWNFVATAARMCQSLGYHRSVATRDDTPSNITLKKSIFWFIYVMDKDLSLCLGRASTLQDYDIALDFPDLPSDPGIRSWHLISHHWITSAKIIGQIYEHLYSVNALSSSEALRSKKVHELATQFRDWRDQVVGIDVSGASHRSYMEWLIPGTNLTYYLCLTIIYRAAPLTQPPETPSGLSLQCVEAARNALQIHQEFALSLKDTNTYFFKGYVDWGLLQCPFAPFTVIFCHTIAAYSFDDLKLLGEVATSLHAASRISEGADRLYRLCSVFYQVAKFYVDAQPRVPQNSNTGYSAVPQPSHEFGDGLIPLGLGQPMGPNVSQSQDVVDNDPRLNLTPLQQSVESVDPEMSQTLGDWFLGNQYMMGLLGSDL